MPATTLCPGSCSAKGGGYTGGGKATVGKNRIYVADNPENGGEVYVVAESLAEATIFWDQRFGQDFVEPEKIGLAMDPGTEVLVGTDQPVPEIRGRNVPMDQASFTGFAPRRVT